MRGEEERRTVRGELRGYAELRMGIKVEKVEERGLVDEGLRAEGRGARAG